MLKNLNVMMVGLKGIGAKVSLQLKMKLKTIVQNDPIGMNGQVSFLHYHKISKGETKKAFRGGRLLMESVLIIEHPDKQEPDFLGKYPIC